MKYVGLARSARLHGLVFALVAGTGASLVHAQDVPASRSDQVVDVVHRSGVVSRCWNAFLHSQPDAPSVRMRVRVEVTATGSVHSVAVMDPVPEPLSQCIRTQIAHLTLPAGEAVTVTSSYVFSPGATAPVPAGR